MYQHESNTNQSFRSSRKTLQHQRTMATPPAPPPASTAAAAPPNPRVQSLGSMMMDSDTTAVAAAAVPSPTPSHLPRARPRHLMVRTESAVSFGVLSPRGSSINTPGSQRSRSQSPHKRTRSQQLRRVSSGGGGSSSARTPSSPAAVASLLEDVSSVVDGDDSGTVHCLVCARSKGADILETLHMTHRKRLGWRRLAPI